VQAATPAALAALASAPSSHTVSRFPSRSCPSAAHSLRHTSVVECKPLHAARQYGINSTQVTVPEDRSELDTLPTAVETQREQQGNTPRPRESRAGASGRARHSAPQLPPGIVGNERKGRVRSAVVLCAGFENKIRLDSPSFRRTLLCLFNCLHRPFAAATCYFLPSHDWSSVLTSSSCGRPAEG
jgi:hypothetical protein